MQVPLLKNVGKREEEDLNYPNKQVAHIIMIDVFKAQKEEIGTFSSQYVKN